MSNNDDQRIDQILSEVQTLSTNMTGLTRHVDRMNERLGGVENRLINIEQHTSLIPGIAEAVQNFSDGLDDHEKRIKRLEQKAA